MTLKEFKRNISLLNLGVEIDDKFSKIYNRLVDLFPNLEEYSYEDADIREEKYNPIFFGKDVDNIILQYAGDLTIYYLRTDIFQILNEKGEIDISELKKVILWFIKENVGLEVRKGTILLMADESVFDFSVDKLILVDKIVEIKSLFL